MLAVSLFSFLTPKDGAPRSVISSDNPSQTRPNLYDLGNPPAAILLLNDSRLYELIAGSKESLLNLDWSLTSLFP